MHLTTLFQQFFKNEKTGGFLLMGFALVAFILANSAAAEGFLHFWETPVGPYSLHFWINDGLMAIFFLLVGLEIEREFHSGELSDRKNALLPVGAALGGFLLPAGIYVFVNAGLDSVNGFGVPMATDIAFALGVLSLAGKRVPASLKVFLTALAIIDDLCAIIVIAIFYSKGFYAMWFVISLTIVGAMFLARYARISNLAVYLILGAGLWFALHEAGVHATLAGVITALAIPVKARDGSSPSGWLEHKLHKVVAFGIIPIFALANAGVPVGADWTSGLWAPVGLGILAGLVLGKPIGIGFGAWLAVKLAGGALPKELNWRHIIGAGMLGGIGFTMSIFITLLAFKEPAVQDQAKIAILVASMVSGVAGLTLLMTNRKEAS